jgi:site-specific DNA-methyltransferase (adenine-specific)
MVVNIADIMAFKDPSMPRFQAMNLSGQKSPVTREMVLEAKRKHPEFNRYQLANLLGCSEQTIHRRLCGVNIRGGKYQTQTRVKLVGAPIEQYSYEAGLYLYDRRIWKKDPTWENSKWTTNSLKSVSEFEDLYIFWKPGEIVIDRKKLSPQEWKRWGYRQIWDIPSVRRNDRHEAMFPEELAARVIKLYSQEGESVLDPFLGSGTTAVAALKLKRHFIGIEKEPKYVQLAKKNIKRAVSQITMF